MEQRGESESSKPTKARPPPMTDKQQEKFIILMKEYKRDMPGHPRSGPGMEYSKQFWENATQELNSLEPDRPPRDADQWQRAMAYHKHRVNKITKNRGHMTTFEKKFSAILDISTEAVEHDQDSLERAEFEKYQQDGSSSPLQFDSNIVLAEADVSFEESETEDAMVKAIPSQLFQTIQYTACNQNTHIHKQVNRSLINQMAGTNSQQHHRTSPKIIKTSQVKNDQKYILKKSKSFDRSNTKANQLTDASKPQEMTNSHLNPANNDLNRASSQPGQTYEVQTDSNYRPFTISKNPQIDVSRPQETTDSQLQPGNSAQSRSSNQPCQKSQVPNKPFDKHSDQANHNTQNSSNAQETKDTSNGSLSHPVKVTPSTFPSNPRIGHVRRESTQVTEEREIETSRFQETLSTSYQNNSTINNANANKKRTNEYAKFANMFKLLSAENEESQRRSREEADAFATLAGAFATQASAFATLADGFAAKADAAIREKENKNHTARMLQSIAECFDELVKENCSKRPKKE